MAMSKGLGVLCLTVSLMRIVSAADTYADDESQQDSMTDEALLEFLGAMEELDEWNEFFDMAENGLPPEFAEANDE